VVIFTSLKSKDLEGYDETDKEAFRLVQSQPGFLGADSYWNDEGKQVTIVKFLSERDMLAWKEHPFHQKAQALGKSKWYTHYNVKVCRVEREYEFNK
jgi:heme-degrading monooxygenase HmoA